MLTARDARRDTGRRRSLPSQRQRYDEYVFQRVEAFKESLPREELLRLADEATEALVDGREDQFVLTEVLMADVVEAYIMKRLHIQKFPRWRAQFAKLRAAQRTPTHWGLDRTCPLVPLLGRVEPGDRALVVGSGAEACAYLLAAYDTHLDFWDREVGVVQRVEQKMNQEDLATRNFVCCVPVEVWMPSHRAPYDIVVLDVGALAQLDARLHPEVIARLQDAICQCRKAGLLGHNILGSMTDFDITIKQGAGAFVCGEETAILASIEGGRGMPRPRPTAARVTRRAARMAQHCRHCRCRPF